MTTFEERTREAIRKMTEDAVTAVQEIACHEVNLMNPNAVAHALKWALDRYPLTVTMRQTAPASWVCRTCWASTDVAPASIVAFPHKPGCEYHEAVKAYITVAREAGWQNDAPPAQTEAREKGTEVAP